MVNKHIWIIAGGSVNTQFLQEQYKKNKPDAILCADRGLQYAFLAGLRVDYVLGDFDSLPDGILKQYKKQNKEIKVFPPEKDNTDTHLAILWAMELGAEKISIYGATGTRYDHTIANIELLVMIWEKGKQAYIIDEHNRISVAQKNTVLKRNEIYGDFISLLPYTQTVERVTLRGFKYPLNQAQMKKGTSLGVSNEMIEEEGFLSYEEGILFLMETRD